MIVIQFLLIRLTRQIKLELLVLEEVLVDLVEEVRAGDGEGLHLEQCLGPQLEDQLEVDMGLLLVR